MIRKRSASKLIKEALSRMEVPQDGNHKSRCSFCGKDEHQVEKLIAGASAFICNECVRNCAEVLDDLGI